MVSLSPPMFPLTGELTNKQLFTFALKHISIEPAFLAAKFSVVELCYTRSMTKLGFSLLSQADDSKGYNHVSVTTKRGLIGMLDE